MKFILAVAASALLLVPVAQGARPKKNSAFAACTKKDDCPLRFETTRNGKKITDIRLYTKCNAVPAFWPKIKVKGRRGKFKKSGTVRNVLDEKVRYTIKGRFKSRKKAVGSYRVRTADCGDRRHRFKATRTGKAQRGGIEAG